MAATLDIYPSRAALPTSPAAGTLVLVPGAGG